MPGNFVLSATPQTNIFSDSFNVITSQGEIIFTFDEQIIALCGSSNRFQFSTASKKLVTVDHYQVVSIQQMRHQVSCFNTKFGLPFATRDGYLLNQQLQELYSRQVSLTCATGRVFGDRDGIVFEFAPGDGEISHLQEIRVVDACVLRIQGDFVFTTRSVYEAGKRIYGPCERLDGGVQLEDAVYTISGSKVVEVYSGCGYEFQCLPRAGKSIPQLQIGVLDGELFVFTNAGAVFRLDGEQRCELSFAEITEQQLKAAWFVSEPYANYQE